MAGGIKKPSSVTHLAVGTSFGWDFSGSCCQHTSQNTSMWSGFPPSMAAAPKSEHAVRTRWALPHFCAFTSARHLSLCLRSKHSYKGQLQGHIIKKEPVVLHSLFPSFLGPDCWHLASEPAVTLGGYGAVDSHPHATGRGFGSTFLFLLFLMC